MQKICVALTLAFGVALVLPADQAQARMRHHARSLSLAGVTPVLAAKTRQIIESCGSIVIGAISARPNQSNHPIGRAVDLQGNPGCIYAHLKGWPGGYSTDYGAVRHVHISYNPGGQEWGLRFVHGRQTRSVTQYAASRMPRYRRQTTLSAAAMHSSH